VSSEELGVGSLSAVFLVGAAGVVLGILALLGIASSVMTSAAIIAYGGALLLSSNSVRQLYLLRSAMIPSVTSQRGGGEIIAGQMASGSAGIQLLAGLAAIVLGILAVSGVHTNVLSLSALVVVGATVVLTGSTLSALVTSFMRPSTRAHA